MLKRVLFVIGVLAGAQSTHAHAGWFGPSNYDECVLDKLGGKSLGNLQVMEIQEACHSLFPGNSQPKPSKLNKQFIKYTLCADNSNSNLYVCVTDMPSGYRISKIVGSFADKSTCDAYEHQTPHLYPTLDDILGIEGDNNFLHLTSTVTTSPTIFQFNIEYGQFYCYDFTYYGFSN